jgi:CheY-like chemotaxis protein
LGIEETGVKSNLLNLLERAVAIMSRILVVEDNITNQKVICWLLESLGYSCDAVVTGAASLEALKVMHYRLILMDMRLPDMDGCETTRHIRQAGFTLPIIAVTANDIEESSQICLESGMDGYLAKPFSKAEIEKVLKHWLPLKIPSINKDGVN